VSAAYGKICKIATLINKAPAKVDPKIRSFGLDLNAFERIGNVPTNDTIPKNRIMNRTLRIAVMVDYSIRKYRLI